MEQSVGTVERVVARMASRTWGVVTRAQLLAAGISPEEIRHRLATGSLIVLHPGVYRVGHTAPSTEAIYLAADWACGAGAALAGLAAAYLLGLLVAARHRRHRRWSRRPSGG